MPPCFVSLIALAGLLHALDTPGKVEGRLTIDKRPVMLKFATALLLDNAEKVLDRPRELRILLSDREVPASALQGLAFPPVWEMAQQGQIRGILIEVDPGDIQKANVILLDKPVKPGESLTNLSLSRSGVKLFQEWSISPARVSAALDYEDEAPTDSSRSASSFSVKFDAPVATEPPVTATLTGASAIASPQVAALRAKMDAFMRGDLAAARKLSSKRANARFDRLPPEAWAQIKAMAKQEGAGQKKALAKAQRVIVRGDRAVVIITKNEWAMVVREGGQWKSDD